jgi:hypothetical protein
LLIATAEVTDSLVSRPRLNPELHDASSDDFAERAAIEKTPSG